MTPAEREKWRLAASERYRTRRAKGACIQCEAGLQEGDSIYCVECAEARKEIQRRYRRRNAAAIADKERERYQRNREESRRYRRELRLRKKLAGQCQSCTEPSLEDSVFCEFHRDENRLRSRITQAKRKTGKAPRELVREIRALTRRERKRDHAQEQPENPVSVPDNLRVRLLRAMRWMDWSSARELGEAIGIVGAQHRDALYQSLLRLTRVGDAERRERPGAHNVYRLTPAGIKNADRIRFAVVVEGRMHYGNVAA